MGRAANRTKIPPAPQRIFFVSRDSFCPSRLKKRLRPHCCFSRSSPEISTLGSSLIFNPHFQLRVVGIAHEDDLVAATGGGDEIESEAPSLEIDEKIGVGGSLHGGDG